MNSLERFQLTSTGFGPVSQGKDANFNLQSPVPPVDLVWKANLQFST